MSTNNSEGNEINEGYNCVWNCNYCYHSLLSLGFSVSRCANGNDCHCLSGLDQPYFRPPALSTCNYWFLLTNHSWCREITGSLRRNSPEMTHIASGHVRWLWRRGPRQSHSGGEITIFFFFFFSILLIYLENSEPRSVKFKWKLSNLDMLTMNTQFNNIQTLMRT